MHFHQKITVFSETPTVCVFYKREKKKRKRETAREKKKKEGDSERKKRKRERESHLSMYSASIDHGGVLCIK